MNSTPPSAPRRPPPPPEGDPWPYDAPAPDAWEWSVLIEEARSLPELAIILHALRCTGVRLVWEAPGYRLVPDIPGGFGSDAEWQEARQHLLVPHSPALTRILGQIPPPMAEA